MKILIKVTLILSMLVFAISCGADSVSGVSVGGSVPIKIDDLKLSSTTSWNIGASGDVPNVTDFNSVASSDNKFIKITANATIGTTEAEVAKTAVEIKNLLESELTPKQKTIFTLGEPFKKPEVVRSRLTTTTKELTFMIPIIAKEGYKLDEDTGYEFTVTLSDGDWKYIALEESDIALTLSTDPIGSVIKFGSVDNNTVPEITFTGATTFVATAKSIKHASLKDTATADAVRNILADEVTSDEHFTLGKVSSSIGGETLTVKVPITPKVGYVSTSATTAEYTITVTLNEGSWTSGNADTPIYEIYDAGDLIWLVDNVKWGMVEGRTVRFMNDIDMNNVLFDGIGQFNGGTMDGQRYKILNLKIDKTGRTNGWNYSVGLINEMRGGTIKNLTIESGSIIGRADISSGVGAFVGSASSVTITGVTNKASVTSYDDYGVSVGGIIGHVEGDTIIRDTENFGDISSATSGGGIIGDAFGFSLTIRNTKNSGNVDARGSSGGIIGIAVIKITIEDTENSGDISSASGGGGIIGYLTNSPFTIKNTKNSGSVTSTSASSSEGEILSGTGGIIGYVNLASFNIENTENSGDVLGIAHAGGIIGEFVNSRTRISTISNTANSGAVTSTGNDRVGIGGIIGDVILIFEDVKLSIGFSHNYGSVTGNGGEGGIVGQLWKGPNDDHSGLKINNSFYLDTMGNAVGRVITNNEDMGGYVPEDVGSSRITTVEFSTQGIFTGWDFNNVWKMGSNYPVLK